MNKPPFEIADVLRTGFARYEQAHHQLPPDHYKVANAITACRTVVLGGHIDRCDYCTHERISYNSCRNRHCPKCQALARAHWVEQRMNDLLPVPYFHVVFTLPNQLNAFALRNKKVFYTLFFRAVSETLQAFAHDPKHLGAEIGFFTILHTWGQNLLDHPHIHCVVPGGGLIDGTRWKSCKNGFIFPVKALAALFKGKMLDYFKTAVESGDIECFGTLEPLKDKSAFKALIDTLYKTNWVVYAKPPFAGPHAVLKYLGRYTHRVAIGNSRIVALSNKSVSFTWKDYADGNKHKTMTLSIEEFIRRFLLHVIPKGFVRIRHYGFLSNHSKKEAFTRCMKALGKNPVVREEKPSHHWRDIAIRLTGKDPTICPVCNQGHMKTYREIPRSSPPMTHDVAA
jgi:Putative transposase/Transposase zinc-binding domain